jgi:hypothetical protein
MKAKSKKIAAIAAFATAMVAAAELAGALLYLGHYILEEDVDLLDAAPVVMAAAVVAVFLGLWLSFKRKKHMF